MPNSDSIFMEKASYTAVDQEHAFMATGTIPDEWQVRIVNGNTGGTVTFLIATGDEDGEDFDAINLVTSDQPPVVAAKADGVDGGVEIVVASRNPTLFVTCSANGGGTVNAQVKVKAYSTTPEARHITGNVSGSGVSVENAGGYGEAIAAEGE